MAAPKRRHETSAQTAGPFVHIGLTPRVADIDAYAEDLGSRMCGEGVAGERIRIEGRIFDGEGALCPDAVVEIWQADAAGRYPAPGEERVLGANADFTGWGRAAADLETAVFAFETVKPGPVVGPDGRRMAPHILVWFVARGLNNALNTRIYFPEDDHAEDPVLARVDAERRSTLIAERDDADGQTVYRFDIHLQGDAETVFFDV